MILKIPYAIAYQIAEYAQSDYPNEACGLLAGKNDLIQKAIPITNVADTPQTQYQLDPIEQLQALKTLDTGDLDWIGIYHSHPQSMPIPSQTDINDSKDSKLLHLIVSLKDKKPKFKAWQILEYRVIPIDLIFDTEEVNTDAHEPLSNIQKIAIIITSILSVILMLAISITLLPPAPEITAIP